MIRRQIASTILGAFSSLVYGTIVPAMLVYLRMKYGATDLCDILLPYLIWGLGLSVLFFCLNLRKKPYSLGFIWKLNKTKRSRLVIALTFCVAFALALSLLSNLFTKALFNLSNTLTDYLLISLPLLLLFLLIALLEFRLFFSEQK